MSTIYKTKAGDTFELISRGTYGTESEAEQIKTANPGIVEPIPTGVDITIPDLPNSLKNKTQSVTADNENAVAVLIDNKRFKYWQSVSIKRSIDAIDSIQLEAPFNAESLEFRNAFRPFTFKKIEITIGGVPFFTGTMVLITPTFDPSLKTVSAAGYSLPGVLGDCPPPASLYPNQSFDNQGLRDITNTLTKPFGIGVEFNGNQGAIFERVAVDPNKKVLTFLIELAKQRKLIISSTPAGKLRIGIPTKPGNPVSSLEQGQPPIISLTPNFDPQGYYSHITGIEPVFIGIKGSQFTAKNKHLNGVVRPFTFTADDTQDADIKAAVEAKIGRMFGNVASYTLDVATWRDNNGKLWEPNTTIKLRAPGAMIYKEYEFLIRSIEFKTSKNEKTATIILSIPGSFSGEVPEALPWDE